MNNARYGLRGVRVWEASNPGPQSRVRPRCGEEVAEDALCSLEFDLTQLYLSDDEHLLRPVEGRHVVPRVGWTVPPTVADSTTFENFQTDSGRLSTTSVDGWLDAEVQSSS